MNCWYFKGKCIELEQIPRDAIGYIYKITSLIDLPDYPKGSIYIGRKALNFSRRTKISKREQEATGNRRKKFKIIIKESDWQDYFGSSDVLKKFVAEYGKDNFKREILLFCSSKKDMTYWELHYQIVEQVLFVPSFNGCVAGKFYKRIDKINEDYESPSFIRNYGRKNKPE